MGFHKLRMAGHFPHKNPLTLAWRDYTIAPMKHTAFILALAVFFSGLVAFFVMPQNGVSAPSDSKWFVRCSESYKEGMERRGACEAFQKLMLTETNQRLIEFALSYKDASPDSASGVMILPLGIMLENGVQMKIDDGPAFAFNIRFCNASGCHAYVSLNRKIIDMMRKGDEAIISFESSESKQVQIKMSLQGFSRALEDIS